MAKRNWWDTMRFVESFLQNGAIAFCDGSILFDAKKKAEPVSKERRCKRAICGCGRNDTLNWCETHQAQFPDGAAVCESPDSQGH